MMAKLDLQVELLEEVQAPGAASDFGKGVLAGIGVVGAAAGLIAFT